MPSYLSIIAWYMQVHNINIGSTVNQPIRGRGFDEPQLHISAKPTYSSRGMPDNNPQKNFSADKERASNVAKIKVVVCLFLTIYTSHCSVA